MDLQAGFSFCCSACKCRPTHLFITSSLPLVLLLAWTVDLVIQGPNLQVLVHVVPKGQGLVQEPLLEKNAPPAPGISVVSPSSDPWQPDREYPCLANPVLRGQGSGAVGIGWLSALGKKCLAACFYGCAILSTPSYPGLPARVTGIIPTV